MWRWFLDKIPKGKFVRALALLSGGTMLGQLCLVASSPVLTRLFTPEDFGVLAILVSMNAILGVIVVLRYEFAIPVCKTDEEAANMTAGAGLVVVAFALLLSVFLWFVGKPFTELVNAPALAPWLWLLIVTVTAYGFVVVMTYWSLRRHTYATNSKSRLVLGASQAGSQLALGAAGIGVAGLLIGYAAGFILQASYFFGAIARADRKLVFSAKWPGILQAMRQHWRYAVYNAPASLMTTSTQLLPPVLLAIVYGPAVAGLFALGQRVVALPVRMLSHAAGQVYLSQAPGLSPTGLRKMFVRTTTRFFALGACGLLPLAVIAPDLFAFVFGEAWREAGNIVRYLIPLYLSRFTVLPVAQTLNILERQHWHLILSSLSVMVLIGSFASGWWFQWPVLLTISVYAVLWASIQLSTWYVAWIAVNDHVRAHAAAPA